jgi:hypothetical protein
LDTRLKPLITQFVFVPLLFVGSSAVLSKELDVVVELAATHPDGDPEEVVLVVEAEGTAAASPERQEYTVAPGRWTLDLAVGRSWRLRAEAPGYWAPDESTANLSAAEEVELRLFPTGFLRGALSLTGDAEPPTELLIEFEGDTFGRDRTDLPTAAVVCPVSDLKWRCAVPAGKLNVTLRADSFVAHRLWEVELRPAEVRDLGVFELELGGSIAGAVLADDAGFPPEETKIELLRLGGTQGPAVGVVPTETSLDADGLFAFEGLPQSRYAVTVSATDYLPVTSAAVDVPPGERFEFPEPLVLRRAVTLELAFSPTVTPDGDVWQFRIARKDNSDRRVRGNYTGEADVGGYWRQEGLAPGQYHLSLLGKVAPQWFSQEIELQSSALVEVEIPLVAVEGHVSLGGEPLAADLSFRSTEAKRRGVSLRSDEIGFFEGLLPAEGKWKVGVSVPAERLDWDYGEVEVYASGGRAVFINIELPGTVLEGEVTDFSGQPVEGATVRVQRRGLERGSRSFRTDAEGRFRIRGLPAGSISIMAQSGRQRSTWFQLVLEDGQPVQPLQLVVR